MNEFFAPLYDNWLNIFNSNYYIIYDQLEKTNSFLDGYAIFALLFIGIPIVIFLIFYFGFRYPYAKWWHWLIAVIISAVIVWIATREMAYLSIFETSNDALNEALADTPSGYEAHARSLPITYANYNAILSLLISFLSIIFIRPFSKIQKHLPF